MNSIAAIDLQKYIERTKHSNKFYANNPQMFDSVVDEVFKNITSYGRRLNSKRLLHLKTWIKQQLQFLNTNSYAFDDYGMNECVYFIFYGMSSFPKCPICGSLLDDPKRFLNIYQGFTTTCSRKCGEMYREMSYEKTCLDRYGVPHYAMNKERYELRCDNLEKNLGVRNVFQLKSTKKQIKQSKKMNHGDENYVNVELARKHRYEKNDGKWESKESSDKRRQTFIQNYGVDNNMKSKNGLKAYEDAIEKKYGNGIRNISQVDEVKKKKVKTCQKNYGVDYPLQSDAVKAKYQSSCIDLYGVPYPMQNSEIHQKAKAKYFYDSKWFDSAPEIAFYIWLSDTGIPFEYKPLSALTYECNGKMHHYFPDFKVGDLYFEIKGDQFFDKDGNFCDPYGCIDNEILAMKWKCMMHNDVVILRSNEYQMFMLYVKQKYGCNYLKQFKNKM